MNHRESSDLDQRIESYLYSTDRWDQQEWTNGLEPVSLLVGKSNASKVQMVCLTKMVSEKWFPHGSAILAELAFSSL